MRKAWLELVLAASVLVAPLAVRAAESFEDRARAAHALEAKPSEQPYQLALKYAIGPRLQNIVQSCRDTFRGDVAPAFDLVADISRSAELRNVEVRPDSDFSQCFARGLSGIALPAPPDSFEGDSYPFAMEMHFH